MGKTEVYVGTRSWDLWWGIYGLTQKCGWEDIYVYQKIEGKLKPRCYFCLCTQGYLAGSISNIENEPNEREYVAKVKRFLKQQQVMYSYTYADPESEYFSEVPFEAQRNNKGVKPDYIELWYPERGIDADVIEKSVKLFCRKFLDIEVSHVHFKEKVSLEEAITTYLKHVPSKEVIFSDELISQLAKDLNKSETAVLKYLKSQV